MFELSQGRFIEGAEDMAPFNFDTGHTKNQRDKKESLISTCLHFATIFMNPVTNYAHHESSPRFIPKTIMC